MSSLLASLKNLKKKLELMEDVSKFTFNGAQENTQMGLVVETTVSLEYKGKKGKCDCIKYFFK